MTNELDPRLIISMNEEWWKQDGVVYVKRTAYTADGEFDLGTEKTFYSEIPFVKLRTPATERTDSEQEDQ